MRSADERSASVLITGTGLGHATFAAASAPAAGTAPCAASGPASPALSLPAVGPEGQWIVLEVPEASFPGEGSVDGLIRVAASGEPVSVPLRLEAVSAAPWAVFWRSFPTAVSWFMGLLVSTTVAYALYVLQKVWEARNKERVDFQRYVTENWPRLDTLFGIHYGNLWKDNREDPRKWAGELEGALRMHGLDRIPLAKRYRLLQALATHEPESVTQQLANLYPGWRRELEAVGARASEAGRGTLVGAVTETDAQALGGRTS